MTSAFCCSVRLQDHDRTVSVQFLLVLKLHKLVLTFLLFDCRTNFCMKLLQRDIGERFSCVCVSELIRRRRLLLFVALNKVTRSILSILCPLTVSIYSFCFEKQKTGQMWVQIRTLWWAGKEENSTAPPWGTCGDHISV